MAQQVRTPLAEDLGSSCDTLGLCRHQAHIWCTSIHTGKIHTYNYMYEMLNLGVKALYPVGNSTGQFGKYAWQS